MARRYRKTCLDAYPLRRERSLGFTFPGNFWNPNGVGGFGTTLWQETFLSSPNNTDILVGLPAANWTNAMCAYLAGAAGQIVYNGAGLILGVSGVNGPVVRAYTVPITYNLDKAHAFTFESIGFPLAGGGSIQQASIGFGIEVDTSPNQAVIECGANGGVANDHSDASVGVRLNGVLTTHTGAQFFAGLANGTLRVTIAPWNGANRQVTTYLNGVQVDQQLLTVRGVGANSRLKVTWQNQQIAGNPVMIGGRLTFTGFNP